MNEIRELRERLGERWRMDMSRRQAEYDRLRELREQDPVHYEQNWHLWGAQWYKGGPVSKSELAEEIGVGLRTVDRWEAGETTPSRIARKALERLEQ